MPLPCWRAGTNRSLITLLRAQVVDECSSAPRMIQARPETGSELMLLLLEDLLEVLLLLLLVLVLVPVLEALGGVESRDEVGDGVKRLWRRLMLWRGRWSVILVLSCL